MTGFELGLSGVESERFASCVTTTAILLGMEVRPKVFRNRTNEQLPSTLVAISPN